MQYNNSPQGLETWALWVLPINSECSVAAISDRPQILVMIIAYLSIGNISSSSWYCFHIASLPYTFVRSQKYTTSPCHEALGLSTGFAPRHELVVFKTASEVDVRIIKYDVPRHRIEPIPYIHDLLGVRH
jgi:hypothetical protein